MIRTSMQLMIKDSLNELPARDHFTTHCDGHKYRYDGCSMCAALHYMHETQLSLQNSEKLARADVVQAVFKRTAKTLFID